MKLCSLIKGNSAEVIQIITLSNVLCSKEDASFDWVLHGEGCH